MEDAASLELLRNFGCDYAQGYFISRPLSVEQFSRFMQDQAKNNAECHDVVMKWGLVFLAAFGLLAGAAQAQDLRI